MLVSWFTKGPEHQHSMSDYNECSADPFWTRFALWMHIQNMSCQNPTLQPLNVFSYPPCCGDKQILLRNKKKMIYNCIQEEFEDTKGHCR
jgi:hypothetical protein